MLTAVVILLSKYFSNAKEKMNKENIAINKDGIRVNNAKDIIYFLFAIDPLTLILFLMEFFTSMKIKIKNKSNRQILKINKICKLSSFNMIKLLLINVKKVTNPKEIVKIKTIMMNKFLFNKANII